MAELPLPGAGDMEGVDPPTAPELAQGAAAAAAAAEARLAQAAQEEREELRVDYIGDTVHARWPSLSSRSAA